VMLWEILASIVGIRRTGEEDTNCTD